MDVLLHNLIECLWL